MIGGLDVKGCFAALPLEKLEEIQKYINHDKTPNAKKFSNLATFLPDVAVLIDAQCKLNTARETAKQLVFEYFKGKCADPLKPHVPHRKGSLL